MARSGSGVYNLTKHGVGAFSESLRQEVATGTVCGSRSSSRARSRPSSCRTTGPRSRLQMRGRFEGVERMQAEDIADAIRYIVTRRWNVAINEMLIRPTQQEG